MTDKQYKFYEDTQQFLIDNNILPKDFIIQTDVYGGAYGWDIRLNGNSRISDTVSSKPYDAKWSVELYNLNRISTLNKIKGISQYKKKNTHLSMSVFTNDGGKNIYYSLTSYHYPYVYEENRWINPENKRTEEMCKYMPDAWDCSNKDVTTSDYRPWPLCDTLLIDKNVDYYSYAPGTKVFSNFQDFLTEFEYIKNELTRCIPIADAMRAEYNEGVKASREIMKESNRLKREAEAKAKEAKNMVLNLKNKINTNFYRKEELKKDF